MSSRLATAAVVLAVTVAVWLCVSWWLAAWVVAVTTRPPVTAGSSLREANAAVRRTVGLFAALQAGLVAVVVLYA